jgi:hypothetical protein
MKRRTIMPKDTLSLSKESQYTWSHAKESAQKTAKANLTKQSAVLGGIIGEIAGAIIGSVTGTLTMNLTGILMGFTAGVILGALTGILTGLVVSKTAGSSGGPSIGAYSGMGFGAILGASIGLLIPNSLRMNDIFLHTPVLNTLASSRFEAVSFFAFLLCILGALVGVWVSGINYKSAK